uniref:NADH dehydrogenase subunit 6 n=1 Tax=Nysius fuscovittatus TaxID=881686 RepID=A0A7D5JTK7_9HEMI|nr:NADH dehydrogenase subunit 6 [Nysius fuscovittatus]QLF99809.1 NADH dehydrogenase subunit 6 [Nysius fuscovittatus]
MNMFMWVMLNLSLVFMWVKHPLSMVMVIMLQTMTISVMTGMVLSSFWFSYIIMMIMMSGMLVLFVYMASIASNEKFKMSIILLILVILNLPIVLFVNYDNEMMNMNKTTTLNMILNNLFSGATMIITMIMVVYLLYTMITVSKIVSINEGPLRIKK